MKKVRMSIAAIAAAATLAAGGIIPASTAIADDIVTTTVTPNPWFTNGPFDGWGTSLAWLANATGNYGEEGSIVHSSGDAEADAKALEYGKQLRQEFYESIFGEDGLDLNMARFNIGGGNASDVAYGYPLMRQGAAVPGYWKDDTTGSGTYGEGVTTKQADKDKLAEAFDPNDDTQYDWSKGSAQEWWLKQGVSTGGIDHVETFANSAPWFLTESGYATGAYDAGDNNLKDPVKFAQYLVKVTEHLEQTYGFQVNTIEGMNESETSYWGTPGDKADKDLGDGDEAGITPDLFDWYWTTYYSDKNKSVTPYSTALKKPQEGMHIDNAEQQQLIEAMADALQQAGNTHTKIAATDATDSGQLVTSYNAYSDEVKNKVDQLNTHSYGTNDQRVVRDIGQADGKRVSMSEVDGAWQDGSFNPYGFDNALGMAGKINSDIYDLQSKDFTFWQVVEDLYNMATGDKGINGNTAKVKGENTNWGTVLIDFDCNVAGKDGKLYSERAWLNNGRSTNGIQSCNVLANSKYNAVRAYTKFVHEGDAIVANNSTGDNLTAASADGKTQTVIHTNSSDKTQRLVIDLSKYGSIADNASGTLYLTTEPAKLDNMSDATISYMNQYSNVKQDAGSVVIDAANKTATVTVPARSIASITLTGVSGVAEDAALHEGEVYQLVGQQSGKALQVADDGSLSIENVATDRKAASQQSMVLHEVPADEAMPTVKKYVVSNVDGTRVLGADGTFVDGTVDAAKTNPDTVWILNTEDGEYYSLVNISQKQTLEVGGQKTAAGSPVGLYKSNGGQNQAWQFRTTNPTGIVEVAGQATVDGTISMPKTVNPYYEWGAGPAVEATWDTSTVDVSKEGVYTAKGTATDVFGNLFNFTAKVYVGKLTASDPVSVTLLEGASEDDIRAAVMQQQVYAHVQSSPAIAVDGSLVDWDFAAQSQRLLDTKTGDVITVPGTIDVGGGETIPAKATVYVTHKKPINIASTQSNLTVTDQQTEDGKADQWKKLTDGNTSEEAWVTWNAAEKFAGNPTATLNFGRTRRIDYVSITFANKPSDSVKAEYTTDGQTWKPLGEAVDAPKSGATVTFKGDGLVEASQVRIVNTVNNDFMNATEIQAYVVPEATDVVNIASASGTHFSVSAQEGSSGSQAIDGKYEKGWSTWGVADGNANPVAEFSFDAPTTINEVKTTFYYDGRASWPKSQTLEYQGTDNQWHEVGVKSGWKVQDSSDVDHTTASDTPVADFVLDTPVTAKALRLTNTLQDTHVYINVAEIEVYSPIGDLDELAPIADATLGDLRLDGQTIDGFDPNTTDYTVNLPYGTQSNPTVQAFSSDTNAHVTISQPRAVLGGTATISVTAADGVTTKDYRVTFNTAQLAELKVTKPTKSEYQIGEQFDTAGMSVTAVYRTDGQVSHEEAIALDDPDLSIRGFDSVAAGTKTIVVSYHGVSATFTVAVHAATADEDAKTNDDKTSQQGDQSQKPGMSPTGASVSAAFVAAALITLAGCAVISVRARKRR